MASTQGFTSPSGAAYILTVYELPWHEGDVIRKLRNAAGWTLPELAERAGVSFTAIHEIEIGITKQPTRGVLTKVAAVFGLKYTELLDLVPQQPLRTSIPIAERKRRKGETRASARMGRRRDSGKKAS